jgi:hypothetical protein
MTTNECQICYIKNVKYTIECGSSIPHQICFDCEREWRLKSKPTYHGRILTCPFCRKEETASGLRSRSSYEAELKILYQLHYPLAKPTRPPRVRSASPPYIPLTYLWCKNRNLACTTQSTTARKCTYPAGCTENVCRRCKMCVSHFEFNPIVTTQRISD